MKIAPRRTRRRGWAIERLESRVVLDANAGSGDAETSLPDLAGTPFGSAEELNQYLVDLAVQRYGRVFGTERPWSWNAVPASEGSSSSFDGTNVQIGEIDESDRVKTDGEFVYFASNHRVAIVDAREPSKLAIASEIISPNWINSLYIAGDRLVVMSQYFEASSSSWISFDPNAPPSSSDSLRTMIAVYDVTDHAAPSLVSETRLDGHLVTSRLMGEHIYLVTRESLDLPSPEAHCETVDQGDDGNETTVGVRQYRPSERCVYESQEEYVTRVSDHLAEDVLPSFELYGGSGELIDGGMVTPAAEITRPSANDPDKMISIVVLDVAAAMPSPVAAVTEFGNNVSSVLVSPESIYLTSQSSNENGHTTTRIQQFAITADGADVEAVASGEVPGTPANQLALDEHDGYLRIATYIPDQESSSALYVLHRDGMDLNVVGSLEGLAPGGHILAARFLEEQAFLMESPLITVDLTDPAHLQVAGELSIRGFSSHYLHLVGDGLLVALGRQSGSSQVSLFDITDLSAPQGIDHVSVEALSSRVFYNPHALSYFADDGVLVVPFDGATYGLGCMYCEQPDVNAFWVLSVEPGAEDPLRVLGTITPESGRALRSLRIGDNLFTVSTETVAVHPLRDPETLIDELTIAPVAVDDEFTIESGGDSQLLDVLANDYALDSLQIILEADRTSLNGHLALAEDGRSVIYTPPDSRVRVDSFTYTVEGRDWRDTARVHIQLRPDLAKKRMIALARQDLAGRLGVDAALIEVAEASKTTWNDACLGVANPDVACAQVLTPGYQITLEYQGRTFEYHTDEEQTVVLAETTLKLGDDRFEAAAGEHDERSLPVLENDHLESLQGQIVSVTVIGLPPTLGSVRIADDGQSLLYTPGPLARGGHVDEFTYEVQIADGSRGQARVSVEFPLTADQEQLIELARQDLAGGLGVDPTGIELVGAGTSTSTARCNRDGMCTNVVTTTFHVTLQFQGHLFSYQDGSGNALTLTRIWRDSDDRPILTPGDEWHDHMVRVRAEVVDANGQIVTNLQLGESAVLNLYVTDLRERPTGIFSVFTDVEFDPTMIGQLGEIDHWLFVNGASGAAGEGLIDEVGGVSLAADQSGEVLFTSLSFVAQHVGQLQFDLNVADELPAHKTWLLDLDGPIPGSRIEFVSAFVEVGNLWRNETEPADTTGDGVISPRDVLVLINYLNTDAPRRLDAELVRTMLATAPDEPLIKMDVSGDGYISPIDVLIVVNALRSLEAEGEAPIAADVLTQVTSIDDPSSADGPTWLPSAPSRAARIEPAAATNHPTNSDLVASDRVVSAIERSVDTLAGDLLRRSDSASMHDGPDSFFADLGAERDLLASSRWDS